MDPSFLLMLSNLLHLHNHLDPTSSLLSDSYAPSSSTTTSPSATLSSSSVAPLLFFTIASVLSYAASLSSSSSSSPSSSSNNNNQNNDDSVDHSVSAFRALTSQHIWKMDAPVRDAQWRSSYGLSYPVFNTVVDKLKPHILQSNLSLPADYAVAMVLSRLAHGYSAKTLAARYSLEPYLVSKITNMITRLLATKLYPEFIKIPVSRRRLHETTQAFEELTSLPNMCGAIDGSPIKLLRLPPDQELHGHPSAYRCRQGYPAVLLQVVADHKKIFWDVCVKAPGGTDDAAHFRESLLYNRLTSADIVWDKVINVRGHHIRPYIVAPHHYKAGAMNVLTRVSGVMTNSPFMLNVDCDMFTNNPKIVLMAMCFLLGFEKECESGFVQCPQKYYGAPKDDPFGNQLVVLNHTVGRGLAGMQGPFYGGTGCFHRREVIYGLSPDEAETKARYMSLSNGKSPYEALRAKFGYSLEFFESAGRVLFVMNEHPDHSKDLSSSVKAAVSVASCDYESDTQWGKHVGWIYGSTTEDILTGLKIHTKGWKSIFFDPDPSAFLGCAPPTGPTTLTQMKRWATGLLEILWSNNSPIVGTLTGKIQFRQCLGYLYVLIWALCSLPELCYSLLPAYSIFTNTSFLPTDSEPAFFIVGSLFMVYNLSTLLDYFRCGLPVRAWWNNQKMARIQSSTAWLFGLLDVILKLLGLSETIFIVTRKDQSTSSEGGSGDTNSDSGRFTFDESPIFVPATSLLLVHLTALAMASLRVQPFQTVRDGQAGPGIGEIICSTWIVLSFFPFLKGLFRRGIYGIPLSILYKSTTLALLFMYFSMRLGLKGQTL